MFDARPIVGVWSDANRVVECCPAFQAGRWAGRVLAYRTGAPESVQSSMTMEITHLLRTRQLTASLERTIRSRVRATTKPTIAVNLA